MNNIHLNIPSNIIAQLNTLRNVEFDIVTNEIRIKDSTILNKDFSEYPNFEIIDCDIENSKFRNSHLKFGKTNRIFDSTMTNCEIVNGSGSGNIFDGCILLENTNHNIVESVLLDCDIMSHCNITSSLITKCSNNDIYDSIIVEHNSKTCDNNSIIITVKSELFICNGMAYNIYSEKIYIFHTFLQRHLPMIEL